MNQIYSQEKITTLNDFISVIIPLFNNEHSIARCIESVINQTHSEFELIIIDDKSEDLSFSIANSYALNDERIKIIKSTNNNGPSAARNLGIKKSIGEFIFFLDSDDYLENDALKLLVNTNKGQNVDLIIADFVKVNDKIIPSDNSLYFSKTVNLNKTEINKYVSLYLKKPNKYPLFSFVWGRIFKSSIIKNNNLLFNEELRTFEDVDFNFRYLVSVKEICFVNKKILNHVLSDIVSVRVEPNFLGLKTSLKSVETFLKKINISKNIQYEIAHTYVSYTIVQLVRLGSRHNIKTHQMTKNLISSIINDKTLQNSLNYYVPLRGDSKIIPFLLKLKVVWLLLYFCKKKGKARYKPKNSKI